MGSFVMILIGGGCFAAGALAMCGLDLYITSWMLRDLEHQMRTDFENPPVQTLQRWVRTLRGLV